MVSDMSKIMIADDFQVLLEDLVELINAEPDMKVVETANTGREIIEKADYTEYDLILMDIQYDGIKFKYDDYKLTIDDDGNIVGIF